MHKISILMASACALSTMQGSGVKSTSSQLPTALSVANQNTVPRTIHSPLDTTQLESPLDIITTITDLQEIIIGYLGSNWQFKNSLPVKANTVRVVTAPINGRIAALTHNGHTHEYNWHDAQEHCVNIDAEQQVSLTARLLRRITQIARTMPVDSALCFLYVAGLVKKIADPELLLATIEQTVLSAGFNKKNIEIILSPDGTYFTFLNKQQNYCPIWEDITQQLITLVLAKRTASRKTIALLPRSTLCQKSKIAW